MLGAALDLFLFCPNNHQLIETRNNNADEQETTKPECHVCREYSERYTLASFLLISLNLLRLHPHISN